MMPLSPTFFSRCKFIYTLTDVPKSTTVARDCNWLLITSISAHSVYI